ncbi:MAG TPA: GNAT family N-acetyltransferase [Candidatus Paceibacterota bacterium]|nr:MAG: hypothetical protein B7X03_02720 [Parcubacteria group bacterium 21-58-10]HQT82559.1 GNAT family N-acetyltransferase [Candidatus Paceibacterota bacterium]
MENLNAGIERPPSLTLERATEKDVDAFLDLERSVANLRTYSAVTDRGEALAEIEGNILYLIREDDEIVGSVAYEMKAPDHAYISGLVIRPGSQGSGIGKAAMVQILEKLKGIPTIDLVTHPHNVRAIKLYESLGFVIGEQKENHFGDGEPRIVMTLKH